MPSTPVLPGSHLEIIPRRLLLVEDHESTAEVLKKLLERHGHEVWVALSCKEALDLSEQKSIEALICDLDLPDGDGYDLIQKIQKRGHILGIVLSGHGSADDIQRSREAGFAAHLVKPFDITEIEIMLAKIFDQQPKINEP